MTRCGDVKECAGVGMLSAAVTFGVGEGTYRAYYPIIQYMEACQKEMSTSRLALQKMSEAASSVRGGGVLPRALAVGVDTMSLGTDIPSRLIDDALGLVTFSQQIAGFSALVVCPTLTVGSYLRAKDRKENVPLVVDVMEGAAIGSLLGLGVGAGCSNYGPVGLRLATGAISGFISGGISSLIGSLCGSWKNGTQTGAVREINEPRSQSFDSLMNGTQTGAVLELARGSSSV